MNQTLRIVGRTLSVLPRSSRRFLVTFGAVMSVLALLDVVALGAIAVVVPGLTNPGQAVTIPLLGWELRTFEEMMWLVGVFVVLIIVKSALNLLTIRIATQRFAQHEVTIGQTLFRSYMSASWVDRTSKSTQEIIRMVDSGVAAVVANVLMPSMTVVAEFATITVIGIGLVIMDWKTAVATFAYLGLIALLLSRVVSPLAVSNGAVNRDNSIAVVRLLGEVLAALKEITLKGNEQQVGDIVAARRSAAARTRAFAQYYNQMPRFVLDAGLVGGFVVVGGAGYLGGLPDDGPAAAMTSVALFAVAGFRLVPSLTRFQATQNRILTNAAFADYIIDDIEFARAAVERTEAPDAGTLDDGLHDIVLEDVSFTYPGREEPAVAGVSLRIPAGSSVAVVGSSGAGKSTLVDLLLGLLTPSSGRILLDDVDMTTVLRQWRASVGYVPQEVSLFDVSVGENVALTWDPTDVDEERVRAALERAQMLEVIEARPDGLQGRLGERGMTLSGGQRQRMGIARGLYAAPSVLVMDEATSALDTKTEAAVTESLRGLGAEVTTITIAHRLATIQHSDIVFYMSEGTVAAAGTFDEVVAAVPAFAEQAALAGLTGGGVLRGPDADDEPADRTAAEGEERR
ncbi:ABC transporter ATP-binding protein [Brachybacterium saurashtrense]|uniref:ABC transporter ATP-binding protein n=1 Tax=Brachybacterium saurashtrense TaxID=556288 RepID=A0A345YNP5_9MICO|nr:ABC transporter ATP-binding protein [Brachybacterium saurashtrense]AXK45547.1 ABC transporter ATP-binding protein [Brachybacterium saurashtrense]RRR21082.1 ABC transporter ATP-binding protein [Brachybacterium saurashtrense]